MAKKFALGTIVGIVAGIVAGVLTAPKSGKETRADIKLKAEELKEKASDTAEDAKLKAARAAEDAKLKAEDLKERGVHAVDSAIEGAKSGFKK